MIPGVRHRAARRRSGGVPLGFVQAASDAKASANATVTITTGANKLVIGVLADIGGAPLSVQVDGVTVTPAGSVTTPDRTQRLYVVDVAAGSHTINSVGGGSYRTMIVAEYAGVSSVGAYTSAESSTGVAALTPTGSGAVCVAFVSNQVAHTATSDDIIRRRQMGNFAMYSAAFLENTAAPLNLATNGAWSAGGMWLS